jgi:hypothetical protein
MLLARVYEVFPLLCPRCGEAMTLIGFMTDRGSIQRILEHLGELTRPTPIASARGPPHGELDFDQREVDAFALSDPLPVYEFAQRVSW